MNDRVLVLNADFQPLNTCLVKRAQWLISQGKVDILHAREDRLWRSASQDYLWPTVIKLRTQRDVFRYRKPFLTRRAILQRDNYECCYCGGKADTMDHVHPRALGGLHRWENVVACCFRCNQEKDCKTLEELGWEMRFLPFKPEGGDRIVVSSGASAHPDWEEYLVLAV